MDAGWNGLTSNVQNPRLSRVLKHIDAHLNERLTIDQLSVVAGLSKFHFHRQFSGCFGVNVHQYIRLLRLRRASLELAFRQRPIVDIALENGYESHEAFSRVFKQVLGQAPSAFRVAPDWESWLAVQQSLETPLARRGQRERIGPVQIVTMEETHLAALSHRGDPGQLGKTLRRFIDWRRQQRKTTRGGAIFNLVHGEPEAKPDDPWVTEFWIEIGVEIRGAVPPNDIGVVSRTIPRGRCATVRHEGSSGSLREVAWTLLHHWLPTSGERLRDFPLIFRRLRLFPDVPEHQAVTEILVPLL